MAGSLRCPYCGGLNPEEAEWCGQCLRRFVAPAPPPPPPPSGPTAPGISSSAPAAPIQTVPIGHRRGAFTVTEAGIVWTCARCDAQNALDAPRCSVCGSTFADSVDPPTPRVARDPNTVALYSLFFPGAGHWYMGLKAAGFARGVLSTWVVAVALLAAVAGSVGMAAVFGAASFALWGIAAHDAYREAQGDTTQVLLKSRTFVYVVMGLLGLMIIMLITTGLRAGR